MKTKSDLVRMLRGVQQIRIPREQGVYILLLRGDIVYVGMTINLFERLGSHVKDKVFDEVYFLPVPGNLGRLKMVEATLIRVFDPLLNKSGARPPTPEDMQTLMMYVKGGAPTIYNVLGAEGLAQRRVRRQQQE